MVIGARAAGRESAVGPVAVYHPEASRSASARAGHPARWSLTTPTACISAYIVVGPTKAKPRRLSSLASAFDSGVEAGRSFSVRGALWRGGGGGPQGAAGVPPPPSAGAGG